MWKVYVTHCSVRRVNELLLVARLSADLSDEDSNFTDDISLVNGTHQVCNDHENHRRKLLRSHLIATNAKDRVVEAY